MARSASAGRVFVCRPEVGEGVRIGFDAQRVGPGAVLTRLVRMRAVAMRMSGNLAKEGEGKIKGGFRPVSFFVFSP